MNIITNNKPRTLMCAADLPLKARAEFDYIKWEEGYDPRFVKYKGVWMDCFDMQSIGRELGFSQFTGWHGIASDSFFSGTLVRFVDDDQVIVGRYFS